MRNFGSSAKVPQMSGWFQNLFRVGRPGRPVHLPLGCIALAIILCGPVCLNASDVKKVALLPLRMNAAEEQWYLRDGIYEMLNSRMFLPEGLYPLSRQSVARLIPAPPVHMTEAAARDLGRRLGVDYVVFGSASLMGQGISLDVATADVTGSRPMKRFSEQADGSAGIIPCIDRIADDMRRWMLMRPPALQAAAAETPSEPARPPSAADAQRHPEEAFRQGVGQHGGGAAGMTPEVLGPESAFPVRDIYHSSDRLQGVALGDVDGDGRIDLVAITSGRLLVLELRPEGARPLYEFGDDGRRTHVGVDVADIDGNGLAEIFVSAMGADGRLPSSFVLELEKGMLRKKVELSPWYFRVSRHPDRGAVLLGQEASQGGKPHVSGGIYELAWRNGRYERAQSLLASAPFNILGLAVDWSAAEGRGRLSAIDAENRIQILSAEGKVLWRSAQAYAAPPPASAGLPMRLGSMPGSGATPGRLLVARNQAAAGEASAAAAQVIAFARDGAGLRSEWIAGGLRGAVRDIAVGEAAGGPDSIVAVVWRQEAGDAGAGQQSAIVAIDPRQPIPPVATAGAAPVPAAVGADEGGGPAGPVQG